MIKANELRIGNYVEKNGEWFVADFITIHMAHNYNPIPITPEILEKCGFIKRLWDNSYYPDRFELRLGLKQSDAFFFYDSIDGKLSILSSDSGDTSEVKREVKYVHQLQNLYFALTGEELVYNQQKK